MSLYGVPVPYSPELPTLLSQWASVVNSDPPAVDVTAAYTAKGTDTGIYADATGGAFSVTLPPAADNKGKILYVQKTDSSGNAVTLDGNASETINGAATVALSSQYSSRLIQSNGTNWSVLASI